MKRRIQDICGLSQSLSREEKLSRANDILNNTDLKQAVCHQILGCTHKDIERSMLSIINEKQLTEEQVDQLELESIAPAKFDPDLQFLLNKDVCKTKSSSNRYKTFSQEETSALINASKESFHPSLLPMIDYHTYSREKVEELMREHCEYKEKGKGKNGME